MRSGSATPTRRSRHSSPARQPSLLQVFLKYCGHADEKLLDGLRWLEAQHPDLLADGNAHVSVGMSDAAPIAPEVLFKVLDALSANNSNSRALEFLVQVVLGQRVSQSDLGQVLLSIAKLLDDKSATLNESLLGLLQECLTSGHASKHKEAELCLSQLADRLPANEQQPSSSSSTSGSGAHTPTASTGGAGMVTSINAYLYKLNELAQMSTNETALADTFSQISGLYRRLEALSLGNNARRLPPGEESPDEESSSEVDEGPAPKSPRTPPRDPDQGDQTSGAL